MSKILNLLNAWWKYFISFRKKKCSTIWVFGEWFGKKCGDNCTYFANYVAEKNDKIQIFWIKENETNVSILNPRIKVVVRGSKFADEILQRAGAIFVNQGFLDVSTYPYNCYGNALSLNFWHGFPWKKIGHDGAKRNDALYHIYCHLLDPVQRVKYFTSLSECYSEKIRSAFGAKPCNFIKVGAPRNAPFYSNEKIKKYRNCVIDKLRKFYLNFDAEKVVIIAYMPTFRDNGNARIDLSGLLDKQFVEWMKKNNIFLIQKAHYVDGYRENRSGCIVDNVVTVNDLEATILMCASDVLISDYSSCMFDYLVLDRPIIQYIYDYDQYKANDRGLYFDVNDIKCGTVAHTIEELENAIESSLKDYQKESKMRKLRKEQLVSYENSNSCEILYSWICRKLKVGESL